MRRWSLGVLLVLLVLSLGGTPAAALESELPLRLDTVAPASIRKTLPAKMETCVCVWTTVGRQQYLFHVYRPKPDEEGAWMGPAKMDVYRLGRHAAHLHHVDFKSFSPDPASPHDVSLVYLQPSRKAGPMLVFNLSTRDLVAIVFPRGLEGTPRVEHWRSPEGATYSYDYELGPVDAHGYRTLKVRYSAADGESETKTRHWQGTRFDTTDR